MAFEDQLLEVPERRGNFFLGQTLKSLARFCRAIMGFVVPWEVDQSPLFVEVMTFMVGGFALRVL